MLNLFGKAVKHKSWGVGEVVEHIDSSLTIKFPIGEKKFKFPGAFEGFLQCLDEDVQKEIQKALEEEKKEQIKLAELSREKWERLSQIPVGVKTTNTTNTRRKTYPKENIAFKCNYCDGGIQENGMGYIGACSDEMIRYNIEVARHDWCCNPNSPCRQYYDGLISREDLDGFLSQGDFVCYESQMLSKWTAYAGHSLTKDGEQKPMKLGKVQVNSLAILTSREPNSPEKDRFVFAVFLVDEAYEGDNRDAGYVTTSSKYRLSLTMEEAKEILFWNYYHNETSPEKPAWGQGLHRYISDMQAASMLKDIVDVKQGQEDEALAQEFLQYFCEINNIDVTELPVLEGALQRETTV